MIAAGSRAIQFRSFRVWSGVALLPAALVGLALVPALHLPLASAAAFAFFSHVCHQDPLRSFVVLGAPVAVCARCLGIYAGAALGAFVVAPRRTMLVAFAVALFANVADVMTELGGLHGNWEWIRFLCGAALGVVLAAVIVNFPSRTPAR